MSDFINIVSLGFGKQSSFMLLNALEGRFGVIPDYAIYSDVGCEPNYVYDYITYFTDYVKKKYDFDIITVSNGDVMNDTLDFINGSKDSAPSIPLRTSGTGGLIYRQCTSFYKITPLRKKIQELRNGKPVRLWLGISTDEIERMKDSPVKYITHYYPLIEHRIYIDYIINWFHSNNLREPGKSACLICPFHSDKYWSILKKQFPDEFEKACDFDDKIRIYPLLNNKTYLSRHLKPLRDIDFSLKNSLFPELIEECEGLCGL
jgi:hypothetical protein